MKQAIGGARIREDVWKLATWDETLVWYARAIGAMWQRDLDDPRGWRFQAAIHGYNPDNVWLQTLVRPGDRQPVDVDDVWNQCQHGSWYFLPWHRGYLGCFEAMVRAAIHDLGGPADDWALPYWDYSDAANAHARLVRPEFLAAAMPDGSDNPLFRDIARRPWTNVTTPQGEAGDFGLAAREVSLAALDRRFFSAPPRAASFGGGETGFSHYGDASTTGDLERTPHGDVHMAVGFDERSGEYFFMGDFDTAGLDPLFWLHHCNLDRLWVHWLDQPAAHGNPADAAWRTPVSPIPGERMPFALHHPDRPDFRFSPVDLVDTATSVFAYYYEDRPPVFERIAAAPPPPDGMMGLQRATPGILGFQLDDLGFKVKLPRIDRVDQDEPELIGATSEPLHLGGRRVTARVPIEPPGGNLKFSAERSDTAPIGQHIYLNVENIVSDSGATPYSVYLNVPDDFDPGRYEDHFVGTMPMFGLRAATRRDGAHGGSGLSYTFDVTEAVARIADGDVSHLKVAFVPKPGAAEAPGLKVGKISFFRR